MIDRKNTYDLICICAVVIINIQDPFNMGVIQGEWGTKTKPTVVPSMYEERIVGCICEY